MTAPRRDLRRRVRQQLGDRGRGRHAADHQPTLAVPVLAKLVIKDTCSASRLWLARRMAQMLAEALPAGPSMWSPTPPMPAGS